MKSFNQLHQETSALQLDFLLTDLKAASTFLDIAQTTRHSVTRARNVHNANVAHDAVQHFLPRVQMSEQDNTDVQGKLDLLKERIRTLEFPPTSPGEEFAA
jgi:hypothetical protein